MIQALWGEIDLEKVVKQDLIDAMCRTMEKFERDFWGIEDDADAAQA